MPARCLNSGWSIYLAPYLLTPVLPDSGRSATARTHSLLLDRQSLFELRLFKLSIIVIMSIGGNNSRPCSSGSRSSTAVVRVLLFYSAGEICPARAGKSGVSLASVQLLSVWPKTFNDTHAHTHTAQLNDNRTVADAANEALSRENWSTLPVHLTVRHANCPTLRAPVIISAKFITRLSFRLLWYWD